MDYDRPAENFERIIMSSAAVEAVTDLCTVAALTIAVVTTLDDVQRLAGDQIAWQARHRRLPSFHDGSRVSRKSLDILSLPSFLGGWNSPKVQSSWYVLFVIPGYAGITRTGMTTAIYTLIWLMLKAGMVSVDIVDELSLFQEIIANVAGRLGLYRGEVRKLRWACSAGCIDKR